jgi:hypothetical protein
MPERDRAAVHVHLSRPRRDNFAELSTTDEASFNSMRRRRQRSVGLPERNRPRSASARDRRNRQRRSPRDDRRQHLEPAPPQTRRHDYRSRAAFTPARCCRSSCRRDRNRRSAASSSDVPPRPLVDRDVADGNTSSATAPRRSLHGALGERSAQRSCPRAQSLFAAHERRLLDHVAPVERRTNPRASSSRSASRRRAVAGRLLEQVRRVDIDSMPPVTINSRSPARSSRPRSQPPDRGGADLVDRVRPDLLGMPAAIAACRAYVRRHQPEHLAHDHVLDPFGSRPAARGA